MTFTSMEAESKLPELLRRAQEGEEIIIAAPDEKLKAVSLAPVKKPRIQRLGVMYKPDFIMPESFWDPLPEEELRLWEGAGDGDPL